MSEEELMLEAMREIGSVAFDEVVQRESYEAEGKASARHREVTRVMRVVVVQMLYGCPMGAER
jgi:hypothetical protein